MLHDVALVAGPVTSVALAPLIESPGTSLLFTASLQDALIKVSLLRETPDLNTSRSAAEVTATSYLSMPGVTGPGTLSSRHGATITANNHHASIHREQEQVFVGHALAPFRLEITPKYNFDIPQANVMT